MPFQGLPLNILLCLQCLHPQLQEFTSIIVVSKVLLSNLNLAIIYSLLIRLRQDRFKRPLETMQSLKSLNLIGIIKRIVKTSVYLAKYSLYLVSVTYKSSSLLIQAQTIPLTKVIVIVNKAFIIFYYLIIVYLIQYFLRQLYRS